MKQKPEMCELGIPNDIYQADPTQLLFTKSIPVPHSHLHPPTHCPVSAGVNIAFLLFLVSSKPS